jgi:hypothetical protein
LVSFWEGHDELVDGCFLAYAMDSCVVDIILDAEEDVLS